MYCLPLSIPKHILLTVYMLLLFRVSYGQDTLGNTPLTLGAAFDLALRNSVQLQIRHTAVDLAREQTEIEKLGRLPDLGASFEYGYLSNSQNWTPELAHHSTTV